MILPSSFPFIFLVKVSTELEFSWFVISGESVALDFFAVNALSIFSDLLYLLSVSMFEFCNIITTLIIIKFLSVFITHQIKITNCDILIMSPLLKTYKN